MSNELAEVKTGTMVAPMNLIELAVSKGSDPDHLEKLMNLQERWEAKQAEREFNEALGSFQAECPTIVRSEKAHNSKYASLSTIEKTVRPVMRKHGLSHRFEIRRLDGESEYTCVLTHVAGHSVRTTVTLPDDNSGGKNEIQARGSSAQYGYRYSFIGALGLTTADKDDDGGKPAITVDELLAYIAEVRDQFASIAAIKEALAAEAWDQAAEYVREISPVSSEPTDSPFGRLWRAPSKGGIWTTEERKQMGCDEFLAAMKARSEQ